MTKTLIFGGNGKVARHLTTILLTASSSASSSVTSVIRNPDQIPAISALGATPVTGPFVIDGRVGTARAAGGVTRLTSAVPFHTTTTKGIH